VLHELFTGIPVPVAYVAGPELIFEFANDAYRQLVGREDLIGRPVQEALPELAAQGRAELITAVLESGRPFQGYEKELLVRRGGAPAPEQVFVECLYQPVRGVDRPAEGVLLLLRDVTAQVRDRRQQEALATQLAATQERYQTLFEALPQGVIYYDTNGLILGAHPAACRILGVEEDEMITWPLVPAGQAVRDEDGSPLAARDSPVSVALRTGEVVTDAVVGVPHGRTGELRWLRITAVPDALDQDGRPQGAYAMFRDLTKERRAGAALREGAELMGRLREANVIGVVVNGEDHVHDANDAFLDIIGYTRDDVEAGRVSRELITPADWSGADVDALKQLKRTGAFRPYEKEYVHRDGHRVPVLVGAAVISYRPLRWVTYVVDLTARQRAEEERPCSWPGSGPPGPRPTARRSGLPSCSRPATWSPRRRTPANSSSTPPSWSCTAWPTSAWSSCRTRTVCCGPSRSPTARWGTPSSSPTCAASRSRRSGRGPSGPPSSAGRPGWSATPRP
jgi:PAS domain S-box-containing protein